MIFLVNTGPYFVWARGDERDQAYLLGVLSSESGLVCTSVCRKTLEFSSLRAFPIPRVDRTHPLWKRAVELAGRLAAPDKRFSRWAKAVGVVCGKLKDDEKQDMIDELDAVVAHLYGLTEAQLCHIFETFHEGWDYKERLEATLVHFKKWQTSL